MLYKYICAIIILDLLRFFEWFHSSIGIERLWFSDEKLGDMVFGSSFVGQFSSTKEVLQKPKQMIVRRCKVRAIWWVHQKSKLPNQVQSIFGESSKMCVAWRCRGGTQRFFYLIASCNMVSC